jgi:membrane fusion protein, copper/silver efflux system
MNLPFFRSQRLGLVLGLGIGAAIAVGFSNYWPQSFHGSNVEPSVQTQPEVLYWYDPMMPAQHFDKPGKSPFMDMDLVPKYADAQTAANTLKVDPAQVQNLGMRKAQVIRQRLNPEHDFPGILRFNERHQAVVQLRAAGFVEKAWPLAPGDQISMGQPIATLNMPEWLTTQNELLASKAINSPRLLETFRIRLRLLGMPDTLIDTIEHTGKPDTRVTITAPIAGVIESLDIKAGMSLASGQTLVHITSIESLWLDVAIPEVEASGVQPGNTAVFYPANTTITPLTGKIDSLLPALNDATRTITARIELTNPDGGLKPGSSGHVVLTGNQADSVLSVPSEAVIRTGKRTLVMVADPENHFRPVVVLPGQEIGDRTVILAGLEEGQEVVVSGQFLLDSEASLIGIDPEPLPTTSRHESASSTASASMPPSATHLASGRIVKLSDKKVGLEHGDFIEAVSKKVSMPAMTMNFTFANEAVVKGFKVDDRVRVSVREIDGNWVIETMEREPQSSMETQP